MQKLRSAAKRSGDKRGGGGGNAEAAQAVQTLKTQLGKAADKLKTLPKKVLAGVCVGIIALIVIICVVSNARSTINLNNYVTIEATGYDGYGSASIKLDWDAIEEKYGDKLSFASKAKSEYGGLLSMMTPTDILKDEIKISLDKRSELANGEEIAYTWDVSEDVTQYVKCKVKFSDGVYTVSGLDEVGEFDAFADLTVTFSGIAPNGKMSYEYSGAELSTYDFNYDTSSGLRNGDTVEFSLDESKVENWAKNLGKIPTEFKKEYTVEGLDEYVESFADLSEDFISLVKSEAEDTIYSYVASSYSSESSLSDLSYAGYIMGEIIDAGGWFISSHNNLYIIYSGVVSNSNDSFTTATVYFPVKFTDILKSGDSLSFDSNSGIVGSSTFSNTRYSTKGYINPVSCYVNIVEANQDSYYFECGGGFEKYSQYEAVSTLDDITDSYREALKAQAQAEIESYIESKYTSESSVDDLTYVGEYLLTSKDSGASLQNSNSYVLVFSGTVSNSKGKFDTTTVYFPVEYSGVIKLPGDEYVTTSSDGIQGRSYFSNNSYYTSGYIDGTEMYNDIVTANRDSYTYEVSEELWQFGN